MARKKKPKALLLLVFLSFASITILMALLVPPTEEEKAQIEVQTKLEKRLDLSKGLSESIRQSQLPEELEFSLNDRADKYKMSYTIDSELQSQALQLLKSYKPDFGAIVLMEAATGKILSMVSYERNPALNTNLAIRASYPAASIFKIVTASAAVDKAGVNAGHTISFNGGNYTLYKKNVMSDRINRWTRKITLRDAFARSINTAFGRLSLENLDPKDLLEYANRFMFNQEIPSDFHVDMGVAVVPTEKNYELTQAASGFNRLNRMSPVQGAMIAGSIVNGGKMVVPYIVDEIKDSDDKIVYQGETLERGAILNPDSIVEIKEMMEQTVLFGTSRKTFRSLVRDRRFQEIDMGGKTGHLTGDDPKGRVDWFVGYAEDESARKVAVSAITVNKKFWTVKSSHLAQTMIKKYFEPTIKRKVAAADEPQHRRKRRQ